MDNHTTIHDLKIEPWIIYDLQIVSLSNVGETRSNVCFKDNSHNGNVFPIQKTIHFSHNWVFKNDQFLA